MRQELAKQLAFWHGRDSRGADHDWMFKGSTYSYDHWETFTEEAREMWLKRADHIIKMMWNHEAATCK